MKASDYKKLATAKRITEEITLPSGAVFEVRTAPIEQWTMAGVLPASLAAKMATAAKAGDNKDEVAKIILSSFTEEDFAKQQDLGKRMLEFCCVEPRVSVDGSDPEALTVEDIEPEDFKFLMKWVWSGGQASQELENFRPEPEQSSVAGANGA